MQNMAAPLITLVGPNNTARALSSEKNSQILFSESNYTKNPIKLHETVLSYKIINIK